MTATDEIKFWLCIMLACIASALLVLDMSLLAGAA